MAGPEASTGDTALGAGESVARSDGPRFTRDLARVTAERDRAAAELRGALAELREVAAASGRTAAELEEARRRESAVWNRIEALRAEVELLRTELTAPQPPADERSAPEAPAPVQANGRTHWDAELLVVAVMVAIVILVQVLT